MNWLLGLPLILTAARIITHKQLLDAILQSPEVYRLKDGRMETQITGAENRKHKPRTAYDEKLSEFIFCNVNKVGAGYTRFTGPKLQVFFDVYQSLYRKSKFRAVHQYLSSMSKSDLELLSYAIVEEMLGMCTIVLPEDDTSRKAKKLIGKKRNLLRMISGENPSFHTAIISDEKLATMAMKLVSAHLFDFLAPHEVDFSVVEPSEILDIGYSTTKHIYTLLVKMVTVSDPNVPVFKVIEEYPDLVAKLFQLLYLPDARERKSVQVVLINLFDHHPKFRRAIIFMMKFKYLEMSELYSDMFAFIYHDILALHRGFYLIATEEDRDGGLATILRAIFLAHAVPLIALTDLPDFADQWTFLFLEVALVEEDAFEIFKDHAFSTKTPRTHFYRDLETINILDNIMTNLDLTCSEFHEFIKFTFDKACGMVIRPSMQAEMLEKLFGEDSIVWEGFNVENGTMMRDFQMFPICLYEINRGFRRLYLSFIDTELEIPDNLLDIIDLWQQSLDLFQLIAPDNDCNFGDAGKEIAQLDIKFVSARSQKERKAD